MLKVSLILDSCLNEGYSDDKALLTIRHQDYIVVIITNLIGLPSVPLIYFLVVTIIRVDDVLARCPCLFLAPAMQ